MCALFRWGKATSRTARCVEKARREEKRVREQNCVEDIRCGFALWSNPLGGAMWWFGEAYLEEGKKWNKNQKKNNPGPLNKKKHPAPPEESNPHRKINTTQARGSRKNPIKSTTRQERKEITGKKSC